MNLMTRILAVSMLVATFSFGQNNAPTEKNTIGYKHSLGASLFMLGNLLEDSPDYLLLTYGYQLTKKDKIFAEFNSWRYSEPLGTYTKSEVSYPGFIRATGIGIGYQRFHWKGLFSTLQATPFLTQFHDINEDKTQKGFQLYLQLVAGYQFNFFKERFYIEPAYALKHWPIDTNYPANFSEIEKGTPKYIFEPSFNLGFRF